MRKMATLAVLLAVLMVMRAPAQSPDKPEPPPPAARAKAAKRSANKFTGGKGAGAAADWAPADVDAEIPAVRSDATCSLPDVLAPATKHVKELVANLSQFTATEKLEHQEFGKDGWSSRQLRVFKYVVELHEVIPGFLVAEETRDGSRSLEKFPASLADMGLPVMALVFHPYFIGDYNLRCEGLGQWHGEPAWQVRFEQRPDRPPRMRGFVVAKQSFPLRLKGRAWISAANGQVLHMASELMEPVPRIRLMREHVEVEYGPVRFQKAKVDLWLPQQAEVYMDFMGHRYRRTHSFSDFFLFTVDVNQRVNEPKEQ